MICPYLVNISVLLGGILSWGLMWPLIEKREGDWYPAGTSPSSLHGIQGYRVSPKQNLQLENSILSSTRFNPLLAAEPFLRRSS